MANSDTTRLTIELEVILRRLNQALRGLDQVKKRLTSIAGIRIGGLSLDKAAISAQRLNLAQQRLIVQSQELANRQERARQTADRLAVSQQRLTQAQQRSTAASTRQADAHVRFFKAVQRAAVNADSHVRFFKANEAALKKAPQLDSHVRAFRAISKAAQQADAHVKFFRANEAALKRAPQLDAHVRAFRAIETNAKRANREMEQARRATERLARAGHRLQQVERGLNSLGGALLRVGGGLRSVGASAAILVTGPLLALGTLASKSAADIDAIRNRLIATEGSLEAANRRLAQLRQLADQSIGVTRRAAFETFSTLSVVGDIAEETINRQVQALGKLNAAFTIDDQQQFFRNLIQIFTQGFERADIKEALGRVPIFEQLLQQAFGTSNRDKLRELKASGKLTLNTFLSGLAEAVNTDPVLGNIGESVRVRLAKTFERLTDALEPLGRAILGPLERIVTAIEPIILRIAAAFERLPPGIQTAIIAVGILTAALGPVLFIVGGLASGVGALATAIAALAPIVASIGLPAILAILGALVVVFGEVVVVITALGLAWRTNFLGIQQLTARAATAVVAAFNRIRTIITETVQRVLPTLQSITAKVLGAATSLWNAYGRAIVDVLSNAFQLATGIIETFFRITGNIIDLIVKLIDGDWRGAWRAFARVVVTALDSIAPLLGRLHRIVGGALRVLLSFIILQAIKFSAAATRLAQSFVVSLAGEVILGWPKLRDALFTALFLAVTQTNVGGIAALFIRNFIAALRRAAAEEDLPLPEDTGPKVGVDVGGEAFRSDRRRKRTTITETEDDKPDKRLRKELDRLREAQDKLAEVRAEGQLELLRSRIETEFVATKNALDRELTSLEANFDDRLVALRKYLKERKELEEAQVDAEIVKELELTSVLFSELSARRRAAEAEFQTELREIADDPKLTGQARAAALQTAELKKAAEIEKALSEFKIKHAEATARVVELERQRGAIGEALLRVERQLTEEIAKQQENLRADLFEQQGRTADAEALRLRQRFTETLRDLRLDTSALGKDLQTALTNVDLTVLQARLEELPQPVRDLIALLDIGIKRAQVAEQAQLVDDLSAQLRLEEERVGNRVLDGLINQREAQAEIVALQQKYRALLLDILAGELKKAELIGDQSLIVSLQAQIAETERLGIAIDEVGQQINQALFQDLQSGLAGIFSGARRGFEGLRDAAISFGERLLDTLNDIAATSIVRQLEGLFKPDAANTEGTVGGFFSKLFGLQPKETGAAVAATTLQTGATTAAATLTTGATTAGASFGTIVTTSAASFASIVISAASALAAVVGIGGAAQGVGGLGSLLGGAATGLYPAVPGGVYKVVEGGYPEAVLTTDPKHAVRQLGILKAFLRETRGLGGRIKNFAAGGFISPGEAQSMVLGGLSAGPVTSNSSIGELAIAGTPSMMRLRQVLVDNRNYRDWLTSSEGEQVIVDLLYRNQPVIRKLGGK